MAKTITIMEKNSESKPTIYLVNKKVFDQNLNITMFVKRILIKKTQESIQC